MRATPTPTPTGDPAFAWDYLADDPVAILRATAARSSWETAGLGWDAASADGTVATRLARAGSMLRAWPAEGLAADEAIGTVRWCLSQLLHGEQAALLAAGRLIELLPQLEAKRFASAMAGEESRHLEAMARYLELRFGRIEPITPTATTVYDELLAEDRWDVVLAGSQIIVEGLVSATCHLIASVGVDPLLARMLRRIDEDERRHLAFARLLLPPHLANLPHPALAERFTAIAAIVEGVRATVTGGDAGAPGMAAVTAEHLLATGVRPGLEAVGLLETATPMTMAMATGG